MFGMKLVSDRVCAIHTSSSIQLFVMHTKATNILTYGFKCVLRLEEKTNRQIIENNQLIQFY